MGQQLSESPSGRKLEEGEQTMTVSIMALDEAIAMIEREEIKDAKTICGILLAERVARRT